MTDTWSEYGKWYKLILELIYKGFKYMFDFYESKGGTGNILFPGTLSCEKVYCYLDK